jgi:arylsulfatase A
MKWIISCLSMVFPWIGACLSADETRKPNVVLIVADDLGYGSLGCYGNSEVKTPHIDQLAASGIRFTDFHSNGPLCSPTRATLMTGRYQQRCAHVPDSELSPIYREQRKKNPVQRWAWGISPQEKTMPAMMRSAGYRTALVGKWHLGYDEKFHPMDYGFDEFRGFMGGNVDYHLHIAGYGKKELDWWNQRRTENESGYATDLLSRYAVEFIERNKDQPFFLYLAHGAPHDPLQGRDQGKKASAVETYKEMIGTLDDSVGEVMAALHRRHLETHTLVIFCSDNGPAAPKGFEANAGLRGRKGSLFEGGHRVPCIASWPDVIPAGRTDSTTIMTMDFLPTFARLADAVTPGGHLMDGINFMPILKGEAPAETRDLHWQSGEDWAVRRGAWKLIGRGSKLLMLSNLEVDPGEKVNRMAREPVLVQGLENAHQTWADSILR